MHGGVSTPRAPVFGLRPEFHGAGPRRPGAPERAHQTDVGGWERVGLSKRPHCNVMRGPRADSRKPSQAPGMRKPSLTAIMGAKNGSALKTRPISSCSAARSNKRRVRSAMAESAGTQASHTPKVKVFCGPELTASNPTIRPIWIERTYWCGVTTSTPLIALVIRKEIRASQS